MSDTRCGSPADGRWRVAAEYPAGRWGCLPPMTPSVRSLPGKEPRARHGRWHAPALAALLALAFSAAAGAQGTDYLIGPQDLIELKVYEAPEFGLEVRVAADGRVNVPNAGAITVGGLTEAGAALEVERVLEQCCINRATVRVVVKEFRFKPILVIGAVGKPGRLESSGRLSLLEVLTAAGGVSPQRGDVLFVLRHGNNGLSDQLAVQVDDLLLRGDARVNIPIFPGDLVNVPATVEVTVFVLGEVQKPGAVTFKSTERLGLVATIARAGGLSDRASQKIEIKREGSGGMVEAIEVDYKAVLAGKIPDPTLKEGDVVLVKESFF
jgi:polysaccharide biosynthesis/export protein